MITGLASIPAEEAEGLPAFSPTPGAVEEFLRENPQFLAERPELYRHLAPPRRVFGERVADHMAAMLAAERRRLRGLEAEMDAALAAGRANQGLTIRVRLAVLALMRSPEPVDAVTQELPALLGVDTCTVLAERPDRRGVIKLPKGSVARLLPPGREAVVRANPTDRELLHAEAAPLVVRDALARVPVWTGDPVILAVGAREHGALPAKHVTATLGFLGRAVAASLAR
jgi:hypothetical protein